MLYPSGATSSIPSRSFFSVVATRIMKNSSRFVPTIDEELHALEQRMRRVARLGEDALVELEPAELAVDVQRRILEVGRIDLRVGGARGNNPAAPVWRASSDVSVVLCVTAVQQRPRRLGSPYQSGGGQTRPRIISDSCDMAELRNRSCSSTETLQDGCRFPIASGTVTSVEIAALSRPVGNACRTIRPDARDCCGEARPNVCLDDLRQRAGYEERPASAVIRGKALIFWDPKLPGTKFGRKLDAIDTDQITPAADCVSESLDTLDERWKAGSFRYLMPDFRERVHRGETFIIAGDRFAIGSSREMSPAGLKGVAEEAGLRDGRSFAAATWATSSAATRSISVCTWSKVRRPLPMRATETNSHSIPRPVACRT